MPAFILSASRNIYPPNDKSANCGAVQRWQLNRSTLRGTYTWDYAHNHTGLSASLVEQPASTLNDDFRQLTYHQNLTESSAQGS